MALDLFVMPLYRYLAGDFKTATERFVEEQAAGAKYIRVGAKPNASVEEAREFVRVLRLRLRESLGGEIRWHDEGETVYARQFDRDAWHALRPFAADQAAPVPGFSFKDDPQRQPNLKPVYNGKPSAFVHLIRHNDVNGM